MVKPLLALLFALLTLSANAQAKVELLGQFSNMRSTLISGDPHLSGYQVTLYQQGPLVFGEFAWGNGSIELARGELLDASYLPNKKTLVFKAKTSSGVEYSKAFREGRASRELFKFNGRISSTRLTGRLIKKDGYAPASSAAAKSWINLKKLPASHSEPLPLSYEDWSARPAQPPVPW